VRKQKLAIIGNPRDPMSCPRKLT